MFDEPLSALDALLREEMRHELTELTSALGITSVFVPHDQTETMSMSDRIAVLVELMVCGLVDDENAVSLDVTDREDGTLIEIECAADDAGKVIGRHGRQIKAIRTIARALGQRVGSSVDVEVLG